MLLLGGYFQELITAWPLAFLLGVAVGMVLCGRGYRIVRVQGKDPDAEA